MGPAAAVLLLPRTIRCSCGFNRSPTPAPPTPTAPGAEAAALATARIAPTARRFHRRSRAFCFNRLWFAVCSCDCWASNASTWPLKRRFSRRNHDCCILARRLDDSAAATLKANPCTFSSSIRRRQEVHSGATADCEGSTSLLGEAGTDVGRRRWFAVLLDRVSSERLRRVFLRAFSARREDGRCDADEGT